MDFEKESVHEILVWNDISISISKSNTYTFNFLKEIDEYKKEAKMYKEAWEHLNRRPVEQRCKELGRLVAKLQRRIHKNRMISRGLRRGDKNVGW